MAATLLSFEKNAKEGFSESDIYLPDDSNNDILLDAGIGSAGQKALVNVKLEEKFLKKDHDGTLKDIVIGTNKFCKGKFLEVKVLVTAMIDLNKVLVEFKLRGGIDGVKKYPLSSGEVKKGDSVLFDLNIFFI